MSLIESLRYSLYVIFYPFKGFWDLKHEKKGTVKAGAVLLALLVFVFILRRQATGFIFNQNKIEDVNLIAEILNVLLPFFLWCVANFAITTLMDGKGSFREIFMVTAYALVPIILINIPLVAMSHILSLDEQEVYLLLNTISILWAVFLLFIGLKSIHDFQVFKTVITVVIAVVGMVAIAFVALLFISLIQQLYNFIRLIYMDLVM